VEDDELAEGLTAQEVDRVLEHAVAPWEAQDALANLLPGDPESSPRSEALRALVTGLAYRLIRPGDIDARRHVGPWGPQMEWADGSQVPPALDSVEDATVAFWRRAGQLCRSAVLRARLNDLCWCRRAAPRPDLSARDAIQAYFSLARVEGDQHEPIWRLDDARRSHELARQLRDADLTESAEALLLDLAAAELESDTPAPGVSLGALELLADECSDANFERFDGLVATAATVFEDDPWNYEGAAEIMARLLQPEQRPHLYGAVVSRWERAADEAGGLVGFAHRQHALELAKSFGLGEAVERLRVQLQEQDPESMGFGSVRHEGRLEGVDEFIGFAVAGSFVESLLRMGQYGPPSGDPDMNMAAVLEQRRVAPLQAILPRTLLGPANSTVWNAPADTPARDRYDLAQTEQLRIRYSALLFLHVLRETRRRFGDPTEQELALALTTELIDATLATHLAHGVLLVLSGDYDAGTSVLLPRIEAIVRNLVRLTGQPITNEPRGETPGGVRTLGVLLDQLRELLDEGWRRYLISALVDPLSVNLRNRALHGLTDSVSEPEAMIVLHVVSFLASLRAGRAETP
jgi:hypothetical protein